MEGVVRVPRTRSRLAWVIAAASMLLVASWAAYSLAGGRTTDDPPLVVLTTVGSAAFAAVGATIASRTGNAVGWSLLAVATAFAIFIGASSFATIVLEEGDRSLPLAAAVAWVGNLAFFSCLLLLLAVPLLFPTGRPLWRWTWRAYVAASAVIVAGFGILPGTLSLLWEVPAGEPENPFAIEAVQGPVGLILGLAGIVIIACVLAAVASLVVRFRRAGGVEREQVKWLAYVGVVAASNLVLLLALSFVFGDEPGGAAGTVMDVGFNVFLSTVVFGMPAAIAAAILRYRLFDIDVIINKTLVYGALALFITLVYTAIVVGAGTAIGSGGDPTLSAIAAAVAALAFHPARRRAQHFANRLVYGERATPYEVLSELSSRFAGTYSLEDALPRLARVTGEALGAERARVWVRSEQELRAAATWPIDDDPGVARPLHGSDLPPFAEREPGFAIRHQGELLGAISVVMPPNERLAPAQEKLLEDVAAHAGLVLRNVALLEDLRSSRRRIVTAADERARALERDIHDGAQQQLVALTVRLRLAQGLVSRDPRRAETMLGELQSEAQTALEDLRDLARGIYPPLLADKGLREALEAQARKSHLPIRVDADGIGRYPQEAEAAVYFCALEGLQNVSKYANATSVEILLREKDGDLTFEIRDDGVGFDVTAARGSGLSNMRDRLDALGGDLDVRSEPGRGTVVRGRVPLESAGAP